MTGRTLVCRIVFRGAAGRVLLGARTPAGRRGRARRADGGPRSAPFEGLRIDGEPLAGFLPTVFDYVVLLPAGTIEVPELKPRDDRHLVEYQPASHINGRSVLTLRDRRDPAKSVRYTVRFMTDQ